MKRCSVRLRIRVVPGAKSAGIVGRHGDAWKVRVTAPPERGRANGAVVRLLAARLGIAPGDVEVVAGIAGRDKVVELAGLTLEDAERRLATRTEDE